MKQKKNAFLSHVPRIILPKNYVPKPKSVLCSPRTHRRTDRHESDYSGHPFRVSGFFSSTNHQGLAQYPHRATRLLFNNTYYQFETDEVIIDHSFVYNSLVFISEMKQKKKRKRHRPNVSIIFTLENELSYDHVISYIQITRKNTMCVVASEPQAYELFRGYITYLFLVSMMSYSPLSRGAASLWGLVRFQVSIGNSIPLLAAGRFNPSPI